MLKNENIPVDNRQMPDDAVIGMTKNEPVEDDLFVNGLYYIHKHIEKVENNTRSSTKIPHFEFRSSDDVRRVVEEARHIMEIRGTLDQPSIPTRLIIPILYTHEDDFRLNYLKCSLNYIKINIMPYTPVDIFVWVKNQSVISKLTFVNYGENLKNYLHHLKYYSLK